jgi:hypothetical protein
MMETEAADDEIGAAEWDREFEQDVAAGKLDPFAAEVLAEFKRGETTEI